MKMQLLRRNNLNPIPGVRHQTSAFYGDRGWKPRKSSPPPVEGELFSLTFPFIDQAFTTQSMADDETSEWQAPNAPATGTARKKFWR
jgi:hypothetical protein